MRYVPCIKAKQNEIRALKALSVEAISNIKPLVDICRGVDDSETEIKKKVTLAIKYMKQARKEYQFPFYLDVFDLPSMFFKDGIYISEYILNEFYQLGATPVIGLDREPEHIQAVSKYITKSESKLFAVRLLLDDVTSFDITKLELDDLIAEIDDECEVDLIFDFRVINEKNFQLIISNTVKFLSRVNELDNIKNIIITSSIIPAIVTDLVGTGSSEHINRLERQLWNTVSGQVDVQIVYGDYTVVSPEYSETNIQVELMRTVQTPRIIYTDDDQLFISRGKSLKTHGDQQYFSLAKDIVNCGYFRANHSEGEKYISDVASRNYGRCGNASKWIEVTVHCHIEHFSH